MVSAKELEEQFEQVKIVEDAAEEIVDLGGYSPRPLTAGDIRPMVKIIKKVGIKDFAKCLDAGSVENLVELDGSAIDNLGMAVVFQIVDMLLDRIPEIGEELFAFLGDLIGISEKEVEYLPLDVFANLLAEVARGKEFMGFTRAALRLVR